VVNGKHDRSGSVEWDRLAALPVPPSDARLSYGDHPLHFGDLRLPAGPGPHPVAVVVHGGCWRREYDLEHVAHLSAALARVGVATWAVEYRRLGDDGGGWPGTFHDVARATEHVASLAGRYPLDGERVVLVGHSAGAHLALWIAGRTNLPRETELLLGDRPVARTTGESAASSTAGSWRGVVSLAGITDLRAYGEGGGSCNRAVAELLGGTPDEVPDRYAQASPVELVPLPVPMRLLHGDRDAIVPVEQSRRLAERARALGDDVDVRVLPGAGHFDLIAPFAPAWSAVEAAVRELIGRGSASPRAGAAGGSGRDQERKESS
jgi:acetyl esterase/lipase